MTENAAVLELKQAFSEFRSANDASLAAKADKGTVDALITEKLEKANAAITAALKKIDERADRFERRIETDGLFGSRGRGAGMSEEEVAEQFARVVRPERRSMVTAQSVRVYREAFTKYVRYGKEGLNAEELASMSVGSDPSGGYLVLPDTTGRIVKRMFETSPMRQLAAVQTISGDALTGLTDRDEADSGWVGETSSRSETDTPELGAWRVPLVEQYAAPKQTQNFLDDAAIDVEGWLGAKVGDKLARTENSGFVTGTGSKRPRGFTTYTTAATADASRTWGEMEHVKTGVNGGFHATLPGDALIDLVFALNPTYLANAKWAMSRTTEASVRKIKDGDGNYLWQPNFETRSGRTLLQYPVTNLEDMPVIATNSVSMAFGDFLQGYQIVDKGGIVVLRDPYTNKPWVIFYTTKRTGGDVIDFNAIKFIKFAA